MKALLMFLLLTVANVPALSIREALGQIETGNNDKAIGGRGEVSRFQIMPYVWILHSQRRDFSDPELAWHVAESILSGRASDFEKHRFRKPTPFELYVLWNAPSQAMSGKVRRRVRERAQRFSNLVEASGKIPLDNELIRRAEAKKDGANVHDVCGAIGTYRGAVDLANSPPSDTLGDSARVEMRRLAEKYQKLLRRFVAGAITAKELR